MNKFKKNIFETFYLIKHHRFNKNLPQKLPIYNDKGLLLANLRPITIESLKKSDEIKLLGKWRVENFFAFPSQFKVTFNGTKKWLEGLIKEPSRILFFIETLEKKPKFIGHIGLFTFNFREKSCEIDNVVRGKKNILKGIMSLALSSLINWTRQNLNPNKIYLRVLSDNKHAIEFYKKNGFKKIKLIPIENSKKLYLKMQHVR